MGIRTNHAPILAVAEHRLAAARLLEAAAQEHRRAPTAPDIELVTIHALLAYGHRVEAARHAEIAEVAELIGDDPVGGSCTSLRRKSITPGRDGPVPSWRAMILPPDRVRREGLRATPTRARTTGYR